MSAKIKLEGGLDLLTVTPEASPGTLQDCLNYERGIREGYSRIGGLERYDGQPGVAEFRLWRLRYDGLTGGSLAVGDSVHWTSGTATGRIMSLATEGANLYAYVVVPGTVDAQNTYPAEMTDSTTSATFDVQALEVIKDPTGTQSAFNTYLKALADAQRSNITKVGGRTGGDIIGLFGLKNTLYAVRDYNRVDFTEGNFTDFVEGQTAVINGQEVIIYEVVIRGDGTGYLVVGDPEDGTSFDPPDPGDTIEVLAVSGGFIGGFAAVGESGLGEITSSLVGIAVAEVGDPDPVTLALEVGQVTPAGIWRATSAGWVEVDLGREIPFTLGTSSLAELNRQAILDSVTVQTTTWQFPTIGTFNGVSDTNAGADDSTDVTLTGATGDQLDVSGFDFTELPANALIRGIEVKIERHSDTSSEAQDALVELFGLDGTTSNKAADEDWPNTVAAKTYGGTYDTWNNQNITADAVKAETFGVRVVVQRKDPATATVGGIDYVQVRIHYVDRETPIYFWDGTTDVEATLNYVQITEGSTTDGDAQGWMTINCAADIDKPRLVKFGDEIRDAAEGGGNLLATAVGKDQRITLSGQDDIDNNGSRYQFIETNFYGQDVYRATYGVSGAGHAFYFDGIRCIKIRTLLTTTQDLPRHIRRHGDSLMLGYKQGLVYLSVPGNPLDFRSARGAWSVEVGDRIVGLLPSANDTMMIVGESSTRLLGGLTQNTAYVKTISDTRGGIEYTGEDMGRVILCDSMGVFPADAVNTFGDISRTYISQNVTPWLSERLQAAIRSDAAEFKVIAAIRVRSKNQYRLYFTDGYVLTLTNTEPAQFTLQRYYDTTSGGDHANVTAWPVRALCSMIDASGRERIFCSFNGVKDGLVFEMDSGRSFDGDAIKAHLVFNPSTFNEPSTEKQFDRHFLFGVGQGVATLTVSSGENYDDPDSDVSLTLEMGTGTATATTKDKPFKGSQDLSGEGMSQVVRIDSSTNTEAPHVLQLLDVYLFPRGSSRGNTRG